MNLILLEESDYISPDRIRLTGRRLDHLNAVLKAAPGDILQVGQLNGLVGTGKVIQLQAESAVLEVALDREPPPPQPITLLLALPRPKVLKRVLQGVTAMGIKQIILLNTWRVEKSYWQSPLLTPDGIREQLLLGLEQGCDTRLPELQLRPRFKPFVEDELPERVDGRLALVAHPGSSCPCPADIRQPALLAIGPEGGFLPYELDKLQAAGCQPIHLGERPLRVETAVMAILGRLLPG